MVPVTTLKLTERTSSLSRRYDNLCEGFMAKQITDIDFQISGLDENTKHIWFAYARTEASAAHVAELFRNAGYAKVKVGLVTDVKETQQS